MPVVLSLNVARKTIPVDYARAGATGIDKRPVDGPLRVSPTEAKGTAGSGVAGDSIGDWTVHGGEYQAVYGYAREDLDWWQSELDVPLSNGQFGENLTTQGIDHTTALVGEHWRIGSALLEVTGPRIPCRTFAEFLGQRGWVKRFTQQARPGAYFRVLEEGLIGPGDEISVVHRPGHDVTVELCFRALTTEAALLPRLLAAGDSVPPEVVELVHKRSVVELDS
ncbi:MOSC domain-containing protein [Lentzea flaviverrucosa]|uniref:MOSC domain-containing protein YiiM n=1 Tax=Lentzea flaviverrucosa TaxID=200379 RepID=A0A1H9FGP8_9PSEU|nr:MOSC domain-containing protein [Lentzea flaviverrucosa]RDI35198.1 MOSC domain-containing protein YiiM [Lentzea flaviverrucosa]SEQ37141.1 MOSC domain-containing protein YiiM [Lentzea flaviverrucosa]